MRTAQEMIQFCKDNKLGQGTIKGWDVKHFTLIENSLNSGEDVLFVFEGLHNYQSAAKHDGNFAYAVTNKRFIMAQKKLLGETVQSVSLENVNDITFTSGVALGVVTVDTIKEKFNVAIDKKQAKNISDRLHALLTELKDQKCTPASVASAAPSDTDQLFKLKDLLDAGILTQEEFDAKKKQLLGL